MKYTYSDEEDEGYSDSTSRRSARNTGTHTPADTGPTVTQSGRQVRARQGGTYGESMLSGTQAPTTDEPAHEGTVENAEEDDESVGRRPRRAAAAVAVAVNGRVAKGGRHIEGYNSVDELSDEEDASEQDYGDDEEEDDHVSVESDVEDNDELSDEEDVEDEMELDEGLQEKKKLVVKLSVKTPTPERKNAVKLSLTPETSFGELPKPDTATTATNGTSDQAVPGSVSLPTTTEPEVKVNGNSEAAKPISIPQPKPEVPKVTPLSPSLTFRGSPEKPPHAFSPAPINVGQNGS